MQTLSEIVSTALRQADSVKVASLRDAQIEDRGYARVDQYLAAELGQLEPEVEPVKQASRAEETPGALGMDDINFALKLAHALEHGAHIVEKLAIEGELNKSTGGKPKAGPTPPSGPAPIFPHNYDNAETKTPIPQASAHARAAQANRTIEEGGNPRTDRDLLLNDGPVIPSGYIPGPVRTNPGHSSKEAALKGSRKTASRQDTQRLLNSKIAQHKMLVSLGQVDAANAVLKEAADIAQNASLVFGDNYEAAHFPDNEGVRNLTKAQARDRNQREAGQFYGEPVKRDSAVTTHLAIADGLKLSSATPLSRQLIRSEMSTSIAKAPILRGGTEPLRHPSATQTANPPARLLGTSPTVSNVERNEALTKNRQGQKVTKVAFVGKALQAVGQGGINALRAGARGVGSGAKSMGKSLANAPAVGPRQAPGMLEKGMDAVRRGAAGARRGLGNIGETGQKAVGAGILGTAGLGTAGIANKALGGRDRR